MPDYDPHQLIKMLRQMEVGGNVFGCIVLAIAVFLLIVLAIVGSQIH
jgi:hypothetical protein